MARFEAGVDALWRRHESPVSVWWFFLLYPMVVASVYRRSTPLAVGVAASVALNLAVVSPPESDDAWATRVVRGERRWLDRGIASSPVDLSFTVASGLVNVYTLNAARTRRPIGTLLGTILSMCLTLVFFGRMADLYEQETKPERAHTDG